MKRSYGVLAILLPHPNASCPPRYPLLPGDRLQLNRLDRLRQATLRTVPLALLGRYKLIVNAFFQTGGTAIAVFEPVTPQPRGRVHPLLLVPEAPQRLDVFTGHVTGTTNLMLPLLADAPLFNELQSSAKPHLLILGPQGEIRGITEGYYIDKDNIRNALTTKEPRVLNLL